MIMKAFVTIGFICMVANLLAQESPYPQKTKIMTLGVFHFSYPNLDVVKTAEKDKVSVLEEPYHSEIIAIAKAIEKFDPTIIAVELTPDKQKGIDSLYQLYISGIWELKASEVYQLGFRIGNNSGLERVYCVDDPGRHYENLEAIFSDSTRISRFEKFYFDNIDSCKLQALSEKKVNSIIEELIMRNDPSRIRESLESYLIHPFKYEEQPGDFTGVDFETGRWYNRNLRIFRNIQRIPQNAGDRILLIVGSDHLNLLNLFFDISIEYELVSPLPYLENAKGKM
jgi:hypothetical protein